MNDRQPSPAIIDHFLATYINGIEQLRQAFPAVTLEAITEAIIRQEARHKAARRERARANRRQGRPAPQLLQ